MGMGTLHEMRSNRKTSYSVDVSRALRFIVEWLECEWRRRPLTPAQQALFRAAHYGLSGLLDVQDGGVITS